jgi:hypothetical protein
VVVPGGRIRAEPTSSSANESGFSVYVRVRSAPFAPRPGSVSVSTFVCSVVLICSVPLATS